MNWLMLLMIWGICGIASSVIASSKGRDAGSWALAGFLLGPIGVLMAIGIASASGAAAESAPMRKCPMCAELVRQEAIKCRYCGAELPPLAAAELQPDPDPLRHFTGRFNCAGCKVGRPYEGSVQQGQVRYCASCAAARGLARPST